MLIIDEKNVIYVCISDFVTFLQLNIRLSQKPSIAPGWYLKIFDKTTDLCKFLGGEINEILWKVAQSIINHHFSYLDGCPIKPVNTKFLSISVLPGKKKGLSAIFLSFFQYSNVSVFDLEYNNALKTFLPSFLSVGRYIFECSIIVKNVTVYIVQFECFAND